MSRLPLALPILIALIFICPPALAEVEKGDRPDFELQDLDGETHQLSQIDGDVILLDFWATWCAPCRSSLPFYDALADEFDGLTAVAISIDRSGGDAREFVDEMGLPNTLVLYDADQDVFSDFNPPTMPTTYLIDGDGVVQYVHLGFRDRDKDSIRTQLQKLLD